MTRYTTVRTDRWAPNACPIIEFWDTFRAAEIAASNECKWESTNMVWVLDPDGSVVGQYEGDFAWLDREK